MKSTVPGLVLIGILLDGIRDTRIRAREAKKGSL